MRQDGQNIQRNEISELIKKFPIAAQELGGFQYGELRILTRIVIESRLGSYCESLESTSAGNDLKVTSRALDVCLLPVPVAYSVRVP